ncbi:MAG: ATP-binding cassette domain-containing protein [Planctomycetes bacterium]|nr:ATP-binding cassette domain-containing protein [Planctomycetota bacterium]
MKAFTRIFKYVKPQWPRVVVVVLAAFVIAILFTLSFMTVVPLLRVMMGSEGLHGLVDRKVCDLRYQVQFYVPDTTDFTDGNAEISAGFLRVTNVDPNGAADKAGLKVDDYIFSVASLESDRQVQELSRAKLLEKLATIEYDNKIIVHFKRFNESSGKLEAKQVQFYTGSGNDVKQSAVDTLQWVVGFLPRGQAKANMQKAVMLIVILMAIMTFVRCIATFYQKYLTQKIVQVSVAGLREDAFAHVMSIPVGFFASEGTSDTISRLIGDISGTGAGIQILLGKALREPLKAIFCLAGAMYFSWKLTLIFLCCAPFTIGIGVVLGRKMKKYTKRSLVSSALMLGRLAGAINALPVVKVYNRQEHEHDNYRQINQKYLKQMLRIAKVDASTGPFMEVLGMAAGSAALLVGIHWITKGHMNSAAFFGLLILLGTAAESMRKASDIWNKVQRANAASERVFAVIDQLPEYEAPDATELPPLKEKIEFRDIVFTYPGIEQPVLKGINLTVKAGANIAVVGPNGSGKTTLINLLPRFYNADSGEILIDGHDIGKCTLKSLRNQISLVTQGVVTFNDTIAANIGYGKKDATLKEIIVAAKRSYAHEFIEPLPEGYATLIGEHGSGFSGGQLQRIIIARAILKNPQILIFDEAMSQVDADSESKIHQALSELMYDRTCFVIAHRFSTVISADIIVVMDNGKIIAQGQHEELIKGCPLYQSLYETQLITSE